MSLRSQATLMWPSHGPPKGIMDYANYQHAGSSDLFELLLGPDRACTALVTSTSGGEQSSSRGHKRLVRSLPT